MKKLIVCLMLVAFTFVGVNTNAIAAEKYKIAWSHYTGWEPWQLANDLGILKKWADANGIEIELVLVNDYVESINLYTGGAFDGCVMTNMDALTIPAASGVDSEAIIVGDTSHGNDGIVSKVAKTIGELKGKNIKLVELSVSHYLLVRALSMNGLKESDVSIVNASDADIASVFAEDVEGTIVTWNPPLMVARNVKGAKMLFDSSMIQGEIIDMMVVKTDSPEALKKALVGAWYETMTVMTSKGKRQKEAIVAMASFAGASEAEFNAQLRTTNMFYTPAAAVAFVSDMQIKETMEYVRTFSFDHGLFGSGAPDKDVVGIEFADGTVLGDKNNVKLRFPAKYMQDALK